MTEDQYTEKPIHVVFEDGETWAIPIEKIANHMATHFKETYNSDYQDEYDNALSDRVETYDWMMGNMDIDLEKIGIKIKDAEPKDYRLWRTSSEFEIKY